MPVKSEISQKVTVKSDKCWSIEQTAPSVPPIIMSEQQTMLVTMWYHKRNRHEGLVEIPQCRNNKNRLLANLKVEPYNSMKNSSIVILCFLINNIS